MLFFWSQTSILASGGPIRNVKVPACMHSWKGHRDTHLPPTTIRCQPQGRQKQPISPVTNVLPGLLMVIKNLKV